MKYLILSILLCLPQLTWAQSFQDWICNTLWPLALEQGISESTLEAAFDNVELRQDLIEREKQQIRSKITLNEYIQKRSPLAKTARAKYQENRTLLHIIGTKHQVQPRFIMALWGMESRFGTFCGKTPVIPALASLAYQSRRPAFFRKELLAALKMVDQGHVKLEDFVGAWDGGLGQCQFMPTSFWRFAIDEDKDGKCDIFHSRADVFASIAHYLHHHGWDPNSSWGREVRLPKDFNRKLIGDNVKKPVSAWAKLGVCGIDGKPLPASNQRANLVRKKFTNGRTFLVYKNYHVLKKWNNSTLYAITTGMLADKLK